MEGRSPIDVWKEEVIEQGRNVVRMHAITQNEIANKMLLAEVLHIDSIDILLDVREDVYKYRCIKNGKDVCTMSIPVTTPLLDKIAALRVAIRLNQHAHNPQG